MFILTTTQGSAYHDTDGMPCVFRSFHELEEAAGRGPFPLDDWYAVMLSQDEAQFLQTQAYLAIYGRRDLLKIAK